MPPPADHVNRKIARLEKALRFALQMLQSYDTDRNEKKPFERPAELVLKSLQRGEQEDET